jgi:hypothetical protein
MLHVLRSRGAEPCPPATRNHRISHHPPHPDPTHLSELSLTALEQLVKTNGNSDLDSVIPGLVQALKDPNHNVQAIDDLASCVFVQDVYAPALAVIMPIIRRGLRVKTTEIQRKSCVILDNVCRLVDDPKVRLRVDWVGAGWWPCCLIDE